METREKGARRWCRAGVAARMPVRRYGPPQNKGQNTGMRNEAAIQSMTFSGRPKRT
jgi:hypothetical protein